ncbi:hypothetical protein LCY76_23435 [Fictibacillus sp. KIGAM418]|uniref:TrbC/VIRB2 family protein n=1 Tax=Fictibacillus marinisediminis TaxID=2878389 RepID=A0A9X2BJC8_9BACL|nr:hypothetical protein [Fictibacillus marinisediminis]MCK6259528.1 hypothetical protein [Fictibacillus marinisediminis]
MKKPFNLKSKLNFLFNTLPILGAAMVLSHPISASAATDPFSKVTGYSKKGSAGLFKDMNALLTTIMFFAGFWVIACLIFAGTKLSAAQTNPQARAQAFGGLAMACVGGWVVYKCLTIAGFVQGFGA